MSTYQLPDLTTMIECHRLRKTLLPMLFCDPAAAQGTPGRLVHVDVIGCVMVDGGWNFAGAERCGVDRKLLKTTKVSDNFTSDTTLLKLR